MADASESNGYRAGSPWWWNVANLIVSKPSATLALIAAGTVWWATVVQTKRLDQQETDLQQMRTMMMEARQVDGQVLAKIGEHVADTLRYHRAAIELAAETCFQQANTTEARKVCESAERRFLEGQ